MERERIAMMLIAGGLLAGLTLSYVTRPPTQSAAPMRTDGSSVRVVSAPVLSAERLARCRKTIAAATRDGVIRERPSPGRVRVDDTLWRELPPASQGRIMQALACDVWQAVAPPENREIIAYGWASGKRLAMLTGVHARR
jgi:hypothetical protein